MTYDNEHILNEMEIERSLSYNTIRGYRRTMNLYCNCNNKSMQDLLDEAEDEEEIE